MSPSKNAQWNTDKAAQTYHIQNWSGGYYGISDNGNLTALPLREEGPALELTEVCQQAQQQGLHFPMLLRFQDILHHRVKAINEAFVKAIQDNDYLGRYQGVFPIKVNQLREVVEEILDAGKPWNFGIEVGSKPELFAALAVHDNPESLIICNGYKDADFTHAAMIGLKLGKKIIMVVEKLEELSRIIHISRKYDVRPMVGIRVRLQTKGSGKWALSGGEGAKFGLSTSEIIQAGEMLRTEGLQDSLKLIHFHIGSQVPDILTFKRAAREATRYYAKIYKLGFRPEYLDVGGGLGINYDGTRSMSESSTNYTLNEYCSDIVYNIAEVCNEEDVPHPTIVSEGGRAIVAHHSVLIVEVFGSIQKCPPKISPPSTKDHKLVHDLDEIHSRLNNKNRRECLHDGLQIKEEASLRFNLGLLDLDTKAKVETGFWHLANKIVSMFKTSRTTPKEVREMADLLSDQYLCNFSVFQSLIDHWALGQLFPIMPVHRLNEAPTRRGTLVDITCDSDGKIDKFIDVENIRRSLPLHELNGEPYHIGIFLVGAYQDVMGDLHNLFGHVNEAHIFLDEDEPEGFYIEEIIPGCSIAKVLDDVQYETSQLQRLMKKKINQAIKKDTLKPKEGMRLLNQYEKGLQSITYLNIASHS